MRSDVNFQISRAGLQSHPARVLTNQIACFTVVFVASHIWLATLLR